MNFDLNFMNYIQLCREYGILISNVSFTKCFVDVTLQRVNSLLVIIFDVLSLAQDSKPCMEFSRIKICFLALLYIFYCSGAVIKRAL